MKRFVLRKPRAFILFALIALVLISGIALAVNYSQTVEYALSANYVSSIMQYVQHVLGANYISSIMQYVQYLLSVGFKLGALSVVEYTFNVALKLIPLLYQDYVLSVAFKLSQLSGLNFPFTLSVFIGPTPPQLEAALGVAVLCVGECLPAVRNITTTTTIGLGQPTYPVFSTQAINWFSIMGLLFLPCALLGAYAGAVGCVAGLGMGFTAGVLTGLIPVWAVLVIVIIIVGLLFVGRGRRET